MIGLQALISLMVMRMHDKYYLHVSLRASILRCYTN